jgi:CheY-like chemotaxis protein
MLMEEMGCARHIKTVQSGKDALQYLVQSENPDSDKDKYPSPDLIFLDINMPAMNGWEFLEEYDKISVKHRIIMVMLTTSLFPEDRARAETLDQISGFENKPLTVEKITAVLKKYFLNASA